MPIANTGTGSGFYVDRDALRQVGAVLDACAVNLSAIAARVRATTVAGDAFGRLPESMALASRYREHTAGSASALVTAAGDLDAMTANLNRTGATYTAADERTEGEVRRWG